jgi:hypothetical protein
MFEAACSKFSLLGDLWLLPFARLQKTAIFLDLEGRAGLLIFSFGQRWILLFSSEFLVTFHWLGLS